MKRLLIGLAILCAAALLGGCPIYSSSRDYPACDTSGQCYDCPSGSTPSDGTCVPWQCNRSSDCPAGLVCSDYSCVAPPDAAAGCSCAVGFVCKLANRQLECVPAGDAGTSSSDAGTLVDARASADGSTEARADAAPAADAASGSDAADAALATDAATPIDAADASTTVDAADASSAPPPPPATPCNADTACRDGGAGSKCIDGLCAAEDALCSDTSQCVVAGSSCVDGVCEPHCSASAPCPSGYQCDFGRGVCNLNPDPCVGTGASTCLGGSTCVEGRCVAPCLSADAAPTCPTGQLCVNGGCIPDEAALFTCKNDGQGGQLATTCSASDTCLHHDCYPACDPEAGAAACSDPATVCKEVTVTAGTYLVCAAASSLGSECDLAVGKPCATGVCIDGFCH
jgi:hypothetical protein